MAGFRSVEVPAPEGQAAGQVDSADLFREIMQSGSVQVLDRLFDMATPVRWFVRLSPGVTRRSTRPIDVASGRAQDDLIAGRSASRSRGGAFPGSRGWRRSARGSRGSRGSCGNGNRARSDTQQPNDGPEISKRFAFRGKHSKSPFL